jgi:hypothetical protein
MCEVGLVAGLFFCYLDRVVDFGSATFERGEEELPCPLGRPASTSAPIPKRMPARAATDQFGKPLHRPWIAKDRPWPERVASLGIGALPSRFVPCAVRFDLLVCCSTLSLPKVLSTPVRSLACWRGLCGGVHRATLLRPRQARDDPFPELPTTSARCQVIDPFRTVLPKCRYQRCNVVSTSRNFNDLATTRHLNTST